MLANSFTRIEAWLAKHAPRILHESLNAGVPEEALTALESSLGSPLPEDVKALYRRFDGMSEEAQHPGSFFYGMRFLPLAELTINFRYQAPKPPYRQVGPGIATPNPAKPDWLTIGFDGSHTWLCVDLAPASTGTYGQVIFVDEEMEAVFRVADSVAGLLNDFAADLADGLYKLDPDALEDAVEFLSPDSSIDVVNWWQAARWQAAVPS